MLPAAHNFVSTPPYLPVPALTVTLNLPPAVPSPDMPPKAPCHSCIPLRHIPHGLKDPIYLLTSQWHLKMYHHHFHTCTGFSASYPHTASVPFPVPLQGLSLPDRSLLPCCQYLSLKVPYLSEVTSTAHHMLPSDFSLYSAHSVYC